MTYVETVPEDEASAEVAALYEGERERFGYLPNLVLPFSLHPTVYRAWLDLNGALKARDLRRYELATFAAAHAIRSTYCSLAHGKILAQQFLGTDGVLALPQGLDETETAVMAFAAKVATDATAITEADVERLRELGLDDAEIVEVVLVAASRCFLSKTLDALGVEPDPLFGELDPELRGTLTVGRPFSAVR
jgi:uncharacterized peroxidase-related enzyme